MLRACYIVYTERHEIKSGFGSVAAQFLVRQIYCTIVMVENMTYM